jgi:hypothetical protein
MIAVTADEDELLAAAGAELAAAVERCLPGWVERSVLRLVAAFHGEVAPPVAAAARAAGERAARDVPARLREVLALDADEQRANPLAVLRTAVRYPAEVLGEAGVPPVVRGEFEERAFPADIYGLSPATWADIDEDLREPGLVWSAAKAHVVLARRRAEGRR